MCCPERANKPTGKYFQTRAVINTEELVQSQTSSCCHGLYRSHLKIRQTTGRDQSYPSFDCGKDALVFYPIKTIIYNLGSLPSASQSPLADRYDCFPSYHVPDARYVANLCWFTTDQIFQISDHVQRPQAWNNCLIR